MPEGISSATWFVQFFIEPLAHLHISENDEAIRNINTNIRNNAVPTNRNDVKCGKCSSKICHNTSSVRDQSISCSKCGKTYHKRCTDRRQGKSNWRKSPWFCQDCVLSLPITLDTGPTMHQVTPSEPTETLEADPTKITADTTIAPMNTHLNPILNDAVPEVTQSEEPSQPSPSPRLTPSIRFPNYSTRQRSSNINVDAPETEFLRTALSSCRSTITQQESEIKRINEGLRLRDKRIMQLEAQIGAAADTIASRGPTNDDTNAKLNDLLEKLSSMNHHQPSNIYINPCHANHSTPTAEYFTCEKCSFSSHCRPDLDKHIQNTHADPDLHTCHFCSSMFHCEKDLNQHIEGNHEQQSLPCNTCGETFDSSNDLNEHTNNRHTREHSVNNQDL